LAGFLVFWWLAPAVVMACPLCKDILADAGKLAETLATAKGYAASILLLLSVPAVLVGGVATLIIRARHRRRTTIDTAGLPR
jgi:hypothetical protein